MRQMDDNLIVRIATIQAVVMSLLFITTWLQLQDQRFRSAVRLSFLVQACLVNTKLRVKQLHMYFIFPLGLYWNFAETKIQQT